MQNVSLKSRVTAKRKKRHIYSFQTELQKRMYKSINSIEGRKRESEKEIIEIYTFKKKLYNMGKEVQLYQ